MLHVAVDAGGSSTRAVVFDSTGRCLGLGTAGSANPISSGPGSVARSLEDAVRRALTPDQAASVSSVVVAMAGARSRLSAAGPEYDEIAAGLSAAGVGAPYVVESDLLAMFCSGSSALDGHALVAGTGAAAIRVQRGEVVAVADGAGWLLGDDGSGFWIGQQVARAVVAALDGRGPATALTPLVLERLGIEEDETGRSPLSRLTEQVYAARPVQLARLAPMAFLPDDDAVAASIVEGAARGLVGTLAAVLDDSTGGPLVLGGSVLLHQATVAAAVEHAFRARGGRGEVSRVPDGAVGAAALCLRRAGVVVDQVVFARLAGSLSDLRAR